ncbi:MAG: hypothetical protein AAB610_01115 [Patescibacteria group bacterium]
MTNLFKKKFMRVPHLSTRNAFREIGRNAFVDWIIVLTATIIVAGALIAGGVHLYWQISSGNFKVAETAESTDKIFDKGELDSLIGRFQSRENASLQVKKGYKGLADPSL